MKSGGWPPGGCVVGVIGRAFLMCYFIDIDIDRDKATHWVVLNAQWKVVGGHQVGVLWVW